MMKQRLAALIDNNFGKAAFYTPEENEKYGGANMNCCERILYGANIAYDLGMREDDLRVSAAFGGGMGIGSTCGAIVGALMVLSVVYREKTKPALKDEVVVPFLSRLREELSSLDCNVLKPQFAKEGDCTPMVRFVAAALDRVVGVVEKADA